MHEAQATLSAEMAAISAVKSSEIVEASTDASQLNSYQNDLDESLDRVMDVKRTLVALKEHEVTPAIAFDLDHQLSKAAVDLPADEALGTVLGAESLGTTLMPRDFIFTRLQGCESFLGDFFKDSRDVVNRIGASFKDAYIAFTESQESLNTSLDLLEQTIASGGAFTTEESFILNHRLYNLFMVNGKVNGDWIGNLDKLSRTMSGLSSNYYLNSQTVLRSAFSYFGGFSPLTQDQVDQRILEMPISIPSIPFKECTYPNARYTTATVVAKQSSELMGGAYFYDIRQKGRPSVASSVEEVNDFVIRYKQFDRTGFENTAGYEGTGVEIKALSSKDILAVTRQLRSILKDLAKVYENGEKFKMLDNDYHDVVKGFLSADIDDATKVELSKWFSIIVRKNQMELMDIRSSLTTYLTLVVNGLITICKDSISVSKA